MNKPPEDTIEYLVTIDDAVAFAWFSLKRNWTLYYFALFLLAIFAFNGVTSYLSGDLDIGIGNLVIGVIAVAMLLLSYKYRDAMAMLGVGIIVYLLMTGSFLFIPIIIFTACFGVIWTQYLRWYFKDQKALLGAHQARLTTEGFWCKTPLSESTISWRAIIDIVQTRELILLYLDRHRAHIVPKKAFKDEADLNIFIETVSSLRKASLAV